MGHSEHRLTEFAVSVEDRDVREGPSKLLGMGQERSRTLTGSPREAMRENLPERGMPYFSRPPTHLDTTCVRQPK